MSCMPNQRPESLFNPKRAIIILLSISRNPESWADSAHDQHISTWIDFENPNYIFKVSNESWYLYPTMKALRIILCTIFFCIMLCYSILVLLEKFSFLAQQFFEIKNFSSIWTICISKESWKHFKFKFDIKKYVDRTR